jgi:hypothetical protein
MIFARGLKRRRETEAYRLHEIASHVEDIWVLCLCMNKEQKQHALRSSHVRILGTLLAIRACTLQLGHLNISFHLRKQATKFGNNTQIHVMALLMTSMLSKHVSR